MKTITIKRQELPSKRTERKYRDLYLCQLESQVAVKNERLSLHRELTRKSCLVQ